MESKHQTPSVILKLMGLEKLPPQHQVRDKQKVLSEIYLQKVASIGIRKKRSSCQHHSFRINADEKEESEDVLKVVKTTQKDKHHNPSKGIGKESPYLSGTKVTCMQQQLLDASCSSVNRKPDTLVDTINSFNLEGNVESWRIAEQGNLQLLQKTKRLQKDLHVEAGLYETFRFSKSRLDLKDEIFNSRNVLKPNPRKEGNDLNYLRQRVVTEKLQEVGRCGLGSTHHQLSTISEYGNGARNLNYQSGIGNDKVKTNMIYKVGVKYSCARKVPMSRPRCAASVIVDDHETMTRDAMFDKYWGWRKNSASNWLTLKSKNHNINQKDCSEDLNGRSSSEKSLSFSSYFNIEDDCGGLHKLKKRCYRNDLYDKKPMLPQEPRSEPSPTTIDSQIMQETCLMNDEMKHNKLEDNDMSEENFVCPNSSIDCLVHDAKIEVIGRPYNIPKKQQSESTTFGLLQGNSDSLSYTSYATKQRDTSEFQEDSVYSLCSRTEPDSLVNFEDAYEGSPISVLDPSFREDISTISECLKLFEASVYDLSELDDEGLCLNVSSDEDCGDESVGDIEGKQDLIGLFRAEESRDFSYVVEVLTEAGICNRNLLTDFSTWHSAECPIGPSVFENLEKKFGQQQFWKRSERWLLFDRINLGLLEILQPLSYIPEWEKPVSRRLPSQDMIEEMWELLVTEEKSAGKELPDKILGGEIRWIEVGDDIEFIVRELVNYFVEELAEEIVCLENF